MNLCSPSPLLRAISCSVDDELQAEVTTTTSASATSVGRSGEGAQILSGMNLLYGLLYALTSRLEPSDELPEPSSAITFFVQLLGDRECYSPPVNG